MNTPKKGAVVLVGTILSIVGWLSAGIFLIVWIFETVEGTADTDLTVGLITLSIISALLIILGMYIKRNHKQSEFEHYAWPEQGDSTFHDYTNGVNKSPQFVPQDFQYEYESHARQQRQQRNDNNKNQPTLSSTMEDNEDRPVDLVYFGGKIDFD